RATFFFITTPTTHIYTLSLHDALPIFGRRLALDMALGLEPLDDAAEGRAVEGDHGRQPGRIDARVILDRDQRRILHRCQIELPRSEEHTSELQSHLNLVCRLLLEKKKQ